MKMQRKEKLWASVSCLNYEVLLTLDQTGK